MKSTKTTFFFFLQRSTLSLSSECKFIWCWISIRNKTLMSGSQECHFLCCQTATDKIFSWFIEIIPTRALEGKSQCFTGGTNGFLSLTRFQSVQKACWSRVDCTAIKALLANETPLHLCPVENYCLMRGDWEVKLQLPRTFRVAFPPRAFDPGLK